MQSRIGKHGSLRTMFRSSVISILIAEKGPTAICSSAPALLRIAWAFLVSVRIRRAMKLISRRRSQWQR